MTSLIYRKSAGGTVRVHDKDVVESCINETEKEREKDVYLYQYQQKSKKHMKRSDARASSAPETSSSTADPKQSVRIQDWLNEKTIKELQEKADHESQAAKRLYTPFLETEETFVKDVGKFLTHKEMVDLRKKEVLHKRWSDQVYEPIRSKILNAIDGTEWHHLDRRKREMHRQYLEHVNKRGQAFLEDDDTEEYYGQALNGHRPAPIKIKTESLSDPLLTLSQQRSEEDRTIMRCMTGQRYTDKDLDQVRLPPLPLIPLGRHGVTSMKWLEMPLHNIESTPREMSRRRMLGNCTKTTIDFGAWANLGYDAKIAEKELQIPRRKYFEEKPPYGKPPAKIPQAPFIDPEEFSDKIININPFQEHMRNVMQDEEDRKFLYDYQQRMMLDDPQLQQPMLVHS